MRNKDAVIIRYLIENRNKELNILRISKELKMDYKNAYSIVKGLKKNCLSSWNLLGSPAGVKLISQVHPLIFEAEYSRRKELLKDKNLAVMFNDFKNAIKSNAMCSLVFGSYAKKKHKQRARILT